MTHSTQGISVAVLVGGKSRRMGTDKALVPVGGRPLIQRVVDTVRPLTTDLIFVGANAHGYAWLGGRAVDDSVSTAGPLAGIYTALSVARFHHCLVVACDMPFLNARLLRHMHRRATSWDVVVPRLDGHLEPLHAVYSRACLEPIATMLSQGRRCPLDLYPMVRTDYLEAQEIALFDPDYRSFINLNTPADLARAQRMASGSQRPHPSPNLRITEMIVSETH